MKYIAYGSNMSIEQMAFRCPTASVVGVGYLEDYKLEFYLHATVEPSNDGGRVPVVVWEIMPQDEKSLDVYEGFPSYYIKQTATVRLSDGEEIVGLIYVMNKFRDMPPTREYVDVIEKAYRRFGFMKELKELKQAVKRSENAYWGFWSKKYSKEARAWQ